jgi:hypothetical protein
MAQHDYIIENQSGAAFRADLNNGLAAIVSQNSGTSQPSTTYAYQWWADTTTGLLKLRNAANNAWITIGTLADANLGLLTTSAAASTYLALAGGTITGPLEIGSTSSLLFEGSTADGNETTLAVTDPTADRTITLPDATGTVPLLSLAQSFSAAQRGAISALTSASTVTPDFAVANNFSLTLGHNVTLENPTNLTAGQSGAIFITQDASTAYTMAFGSYWDFTNGTAPTVTSMLSAVDLLVYTVRSTTSIHAQLITNLS